MERAISLAKAPKQGGGEDEEEEEEEEAAGAGEGFIGCQCNLLKVEDVDE